MWIISWSNETKATLRSWIYTLKTSKILLSPWWSSYIIWQLAVPSLKGSGQQQKKKKNTYFYPLFINKWLNDLDIYAVFNVSHRYKGNKKEKNIHNPYTTFKLTWNTKDNNLFFKTIRRFSNVDVWYISFRHKIIKKKGILQSIYSFFREFYFCFAFKMGFYPFDSYLCILLA